MRADLLVEDTVIRFLAILLLLGCGAETAGKHGARDAAVNLDGGSEPDAFVSEDGGLDASHDGEDAGHATLDASTDGGTDAGLVRDAGVDAGPVDGGWDGGTDAGPPDPCAACTATEVCVADTCVFDDDPDREWMLLVHSVHSQIPTLPYFEWDTQCECEESFSTGEADIWVRLSYINPAGDWRNVLDGTSGPSPFGYVYYTPPWEAFTGTLEGFQSVYIRFEDYDHFGGGEGVGSLLDGGGIWEETSLPFLEEAAHDGVMRVTERVEASTGRPIRFVWNIVPAP